MDNQFPPGYMSYGQQFKPEPGQQQQPTSQQSQIKLHPSAVQPSNAYRNSVTMEASGARTHHEAMLRTFLPDDTSALARQDRTRLPDLHLQRKDTRLAGSMRTTGSQSDGLVRRDEDDRLRTREETDRSSQRVLVSGRSEFYRHELDRLERERRENDQREAWKREEARIKSEMEIKRLKDEAKRAADDQEHNADRKRVIEDYDRKQREVKEKAKADEIRFTEKRERETREAKEEEQRLYNASPRTRRIMMHSREMSARDYIERSGGRSRQYQEQARPLSPEMMGSSRTVQDAHDSDFIRNLKEEQERAIRMQGRYAQQERQERMETPTGSSRDKVEYIRRTEGRPPVMVRRGSGKPRPTSREEEQPRPFTHRPTGQIPPSSSTKPPHQNLRPLPRRFMDGDPLLAAALETQDYSDEPSRAYPLRDIGFGSPSIQRAESTDSIPSPKRQRHPSLIPWEDFLASKPNTRRERDSFVEHQQRFHIVCETISRDATSSELAKASVCLRAVMEPHMRRPESHYLHSAPLMLPKT